MLNAVRNPISIATYGLASSAFARHYSQNLGWFLFLALLRCFSSGGSPHIPIWFSICWLICNQPGCPIRKSADIMSAYDSPQLIAVNHVLLRLPVPRHSPCALCSLTFFSRCRYCTKPVASDPTGSRRKALPFQSLLGSNATTNCSLCDPLNLRLLSFSLVDNCNL